MRRVVITGLGLVSPLASGVTKAWERLIAGGSGIAAIQSFDVSDLPCKIAGQVLYGESDIGKPKLEVALGRLREINPLIELVGHAARIDATNAMTLLSGYDIVVDGSDNFPTRYLVNDACVLAGKPNVYGSIFRFEGQSSVFWGARGPCYRCLFPEPPPPGLVPSCAEGGVLGILPAIIGSLQSEVGHEFREGGREVMAGQEGEIGG